MGACASITFFRKYFVLLVCMSACMRVSAYCDDKHVAKVHPWDQKSENFFHVDHKGGIIDLIIINQLSLSSPCCNAKS